MIKTFTYYVFKVMSEDVGPFTYGTKRNYNATNICKTHYINIISQSRRKSETISPFCIRKLKINQLLTILRETYLKCLWKST